MHVWLDLDMVQNQFPVPLQATLKQAFFCDLLSIC